MSDKIKNLVDNFKDAAIKESQRLFYDVEPVDWTTAAFDKEHGGDAVDLAVFNLTKKNYWEADKHRVSNDLVNWNNHSPILKTTVARVFVALTRNDTLQSIVGVAHIKPHSLTPHEPHVLNGIEWTESIHAQSYSRIFQTLLTPDEIAEANAWAIKHPTLSAKLALFEKIYRSGDPALIRMASCFFEGFMFWTSFFLPLWLDEFEDKRLQVTTTIIRLIIRDEGIHAYYIGYKFQQQLRAYAAFSDEADKEKVYQELHEYYRLKAMEFFKELYDLEIQYTEDLYSDLGIVDDVKQFLHYNANKTFQQLGYDGDIFPEEISTPNPKVIALMNGDTTDDVFSGELSTYKNLQYGEEEDSAWDSVLAEFDRRKQLLK